MKSGKKGVWIEKSSCGSLYKDQCISWTNVCPKLFGWLTQYVLCSSFKLCFIVIGENHIAGSGFSLLRIPFYLLVGDFRIWKLFAIYSLNQYIALKGIIEIYKDIFFALVFPKKWCSKKFLAVKHLVWICHGRNWWNAVSEPCILWCVDFPCGSKQFPQKKELWMHSPLLKSWSQECSSNINWKRSLLTLEKLILFRYTIQMGNENINFLGHAAMKLRIV